MSTEYVHPAVKAIKDMMEQYGHQWPPRAEFSGWPSCWMPYQEITDEMSEVCHELNDVEKFRSWMEQQLDDKIDLAEVMTHVQQRMRTDDPVFLGFLAPLSYMANLYRWGTIPGTEAERARKTLEFPEAIWTPFTTINNFWNVVDRGTTFGLNVCNCCYDDAENPDKPTGMRFYFNHLPDMRTYEKNFFTSFLDMENVFRPALFSICDYLTETEAARISPEYAVEVMQRRVELLGDIRKRLVKVSRVFSSYMKDQLISLKHWAAYVQGLPAWNINGNEGGASGGESLTFQCMDEFLGTLGEGVIFAGGIRKREGIPIQYNRVLDTLHEHGNEYRFQSFIPGVEPADDPVLKAKDELIQMLYTWRLSHAKVAPKYLKNSTMTSGGSLDKVMEGGETLESRGERELRERARETAAYLSAPPKVAKAELEKMKHMGVGVKVNSGQAGDVTALNSANVGYLSKVYGVVMHSAYMAVSKVMRWETVKVIRPSF